MTPQLVGLLLTIVCIREATPAIPATQPSHGSSFLPQSDANRQYQPSPVAIGFVPESMDLSQLLTHYFGPDYFFYSQASPYQLPGGGLSVTQRPQRPSYLPSPLVYPRPFADDEPEDSVAVLEYLYSDNEKIHPQYSATRLDPQAAGIGEGTEEVAVRQESISVTQKPQRPFYASNPVVYPRPTTERTVESSPTVLEDEQKLAEYLGDENDKNSSQNLTKDPGPAISVTQKPIYPPYQPGPWVYPKPTTDRNDGSSTTSSTPVPNVVSLVEYLGSENDTKTDEKSPVSLPESISVTQKPVYPPYQPGPWVYPIPTTDRNDGSSTPTSTPTPNVESLVEYLGVENVGSNQENSEKTPSIPIIPEPQRPSYVPIPWVYPGPVADNVKTNDSTTTLSSSSAQPETPESVVEYIGPDSNSSEPDVKVPESIPITPKPQRPSYVPGPWIYPQPFTDTDETTVTTVLSESSQSVVEYIGGDNSSSESNTPESLPITPKPDRPSYVPCPWIYPQPLNDTTECYPEQSESPQNVVEHIGTEVDNVPGNASHRPESIPITPKPQRPSYVPGPWIYPQPFTHTPDNETTRTDSPEQIGEYFGSDNGTTTTTTTKSSTPSSEKYVPPGSISVTQKPPRPFYAPDPWVYPRPTTGRTADPTADTSSTTAVPSRDQLGSSSDDADKSVAQENASKDVEVKETSTNKTVENVSKDNKSEEKEIKKS